MRMQNKFAPKNYFDLSSFSYNELFADVSASWELLPKLIPFIESLFKTGKIVGNYQGRDDVFVGEGTLIHPSVEISGPAIIGKNCVISHAAFIRGGCLFGDSVHIGHATEVKHSLFLDNSTAAHLNYIGDSIIGNKVNISGGAMLANYKLNKKPVSIWYENEKIQTGLQKCGAIIGDDSMIGVNAVLNPGTILGKNCRVYPLVSVKGVYDDEQTISS